MKKIINFAKQATKWLLLFALFIILQNVSSHIGHRAGLRSVGIDPDKVTQRP